MEFQYENQDVHFKNEQKNFCLKNILKNIIEDMILICLALLVGLCVNQFILTNAYIPTGSMESTIPKKSRVIGNRLAYINDTPERGDIIIFPYPDDESQIYIKRVIGLPGETLEVIDGVVYINGTMLEEDYLKEKMIGSFGPYTIPKDCYFVMGDNRNDSLDARFWFNQFVHKDKIQSKAVLMIYPKIKIFD